MNPPNPLRSNHRAQTCFSTLGTAELTFAETINLAVNCEMAAIEIRCLSGQTIAPENFADLFPAPNDARHRLQTAKLELTGLGTSVKLFEADPVDIDTLVEFARLADALNCPWLRVFDGGKIGEFLSDVTWAKTQSFVANWQERRRSLGLSANIMVETHDGLTSIASAVQFRKLLPHTAILWDSHHTWRAGGESLSGYFEAAREAIVHVHVKDSVPVASERKPFTYCIPGQGDFPWAELGALIKGSQFPGKLSLEWEKHWHPYLPPITEAIPPYHDILCGW